MDNITIVNSELYNITGIGVKKIKLDGNKLMTIKEKGVLKKPVVTKERIKVTNPVEEEITNPVMDFSPEIEEAKSSFLYSGNNKKDEYEIDDEVINAKVSRNYGGYR